MQATALARRVGSWLRTLAIVIALVSGAGLLDHFKLLTAANALISDFRFQLGSRPVTGDVVLVDIDAKSLQSVGLWPWPRTLYAELARKLQGMGVSQIAFDVDFSAHSTSTADAAFADALSAADVAIFLAALDERAASNVQWTAVSLPIP